MIESNDVDRYYWPKFILASCLIAAATATANEVAKVLAEALRKRWDLKASDDKGETPKASP